MNFPTHPITSQEIRERISPWNKAESRRIMAAVIRWADSLRPDPLPKATWWAGDPYGRPPESVLEWAGRTCRANPTTTFRFVPGPLDVPEDKLADYQQTGGIKIARAKSPADATKKLRSLGVKTSDKETS